MRKNVWVLVLLIVAALAQRAPAQPEPKAWAAVAAFVDSQTIAILRVDSTRVDANALVAKVMERGRFDPQKLGFTPVPDLVRLLTDLRAAGGKDLYLVFSLADVVAGGPYVPHFMVVPLSEKADGEQIARCFGASQGRYQRMGNALVLASEDILKRLRSLKADPRPELEAAFAAAGDTAVQVVVIPPADARRVVEELMPTLPVEFGGGPSTALTRGLLWGAVGVNPPPKMSLQLTIQSQDAASAEALRQFLPDLLGTLTEDGALKQVMPNIEEVRAIVMPALAGNRLTLTLDEGQMNVLLTDTLRSILFAPTRAGLARSRKQVHDILVGIIIYENDHGEWPGGLQELVKGNYTAAGNLEAPRRLGLEGHYVYRRPLPPAKEALAVVIHEAYKRWPEGGIVVGFRDGHVETIAEEGQFLDRLAVGAPTNR